VAEPSTLRQDLGATLVGRAVGLPVYVNLGVRSLWMSGVMVGSGVVVSRVLEKGRICGRDILAREAVRSRVLFVVSFWWGVVCVSV